MNPEATVADWSSGQCSPALFSVQPRPGVLTHCPTHAFHQSPPASGSHPAFLTYFTRPPEQCLPVPSSFAPPTPCLLPSHILFPCLLHSFISQPGSLPDLHASQGQDGCCCPALPRPRGPSNHSTGPTVWPRFVLPPALSAGCLRAGSLASVFPFQQVPPKYLGDYANKVAEYLHRIMEGLSYLGLGAASSLTQLHPLASRLYRHTKRPPSPPPAWPPPEPAGPAAPEGMDAEHLKALLRWKHSDCTPFSRVGSRDPHADDPFRLLSQAVPEARSMSEPNHSLKYRR